ncbi:MAG TPA: ribonuclease H-like domain-containing protein [Pirellulales bacterium]|jgi:hypothetical protein|nr:ribonuclease H-like domain-containing protein [Pirellulales bacterium]
MLTNTFCHIPGIGETTERALWSTGITSWNAVREATPQCLPRHWRDSWSRHIEESGRQYADRNARYFAENLPSSQLWRLFRDFHDSCAFVDIETTGLYAWHKVTTAVIYDGLSVRHYVNGENLDDFPKDLLDYSLLVTYNGRCFDVPFIERFFCVNIPLAHIDLRYALNSLGIKGGLKGCERQVGIARPGLEDVDGFAAVLLWREYERRKNAKALETLLAYNIRDTIALHALMVHAHNEKVKSTPFSDSHSLPSPLLPEPAFEADQQTVARVARPIFAAEPTRVPVGAIWR